MYSSQPGAYLTGLVDTEPNGEQTEKVRLLGSLSDFVCEELGTQNALVREGQMSADQLFDKIEALVLDIPDERFVSLLDSSKTDERRACILDLVWCIRSLDIAYDSAFNTNQGYIIRRDNSVLMQRTKLLSDFEQRHPQLSWSDIAIYHPVNDPRTFLELGENRDQEVLLYRTQKGIDDVFKQITEISRYDRVSVELLKSVIDDLDAVVAAVVHLNRVRTLGQFYQLDPYLGGNGQYIGHGTGAFSAWSYTAGYFLGDNRVYWDRAVKPENQLAFDRDADGYIDLMSTDNFRTLSQIIDDMDASEIEKDVLRALAKVANAKFALFLRAHRGAIKKHAEGSFDFPAPAELSITNKEAIDDAIEAANDGRPVRFHPQRRIEDN